MHARYDSDPMNPASRMSVAENLKADIERAITVDVTLGSLVTDARLLTAAEFIQVGAPPVILTQPIELRLYRAYRSP